MGVYFDKNGQKLYTEKEVHKIKQEFFQKGYDEGRKNYGKKSKV